MSIEEYPLPTPEELFSTLSAVKIFCKLDLSQAYLQLPMEDNSKPYLTINTHLGLNVYNCLPFGISSTPAIFQKLMDTVLQGILECAAILMIFILVSISDEDSHLHILEQVFIPPTILMHGFRLKLEKCEFLLKSIKYLGHVITKDGIEPVPSKVEAIVIAPPRANVQQLR